MTSQLFFKSIKILLLQLWRTQINYKNIVLWVSIERDSTLNHHHVVIWIFLQQFLHKVSFVLIRKIFIQISRDFLNGKNFIDILRVLILSIKSAMQKCFCLFSFFLRLEFNSCYFFINKGLIWLISGFNLLINIVIPGFNWVNYSWGKFIEFH
jgi:hypothetical protein